ncbi:glutamate 5-kinase [Halorutilales archaeon Cl-col2-1]
MQDNDIQKTRSTDGGEFHVRGDEARRIAADAGRVVVKAGTNSLTDEDSNLDDSKLDKLVDDLMDLVERGKEVILVSSGAVGAGKGRVDHPTDSIEDIQAASTIGQSRLMRRYSESFERYGVEVAQVLITHEDLNDTDRFTNFRNTVETLFDWGVVPIINENDAIAVEEIKIGDNDIISSSIATGVDADLLVTLTDVGGVYTENPKENPDAEIVREVGEDFDEIRELVDETSSGGFGGIETKVDGARKVNERGIPAVIAGSAEEDVLERIAEGDVVGTLFLPVNRDEEDGNDE